jgi:hypothetical protein
MMAFPMWLLTEQYATQTPALRNMLHHLHMVLDAQLYDPNLIWHSELVDLLYRFASSAPGAPRPGSWHWRAYLRIHPTLPMPLELSDVGIEPMLSGDAVMLLRRVKIELPHQPIGGDPGSINMLLLNREEEDAMELDSPRPPPPPLGLNDIVKRLSPTNRVWQVQDTPALIVIRFGQHQMTSRSIRLKLMGRGAVALILPLFILPTPADWSLRLDRQFNLQYKPVPNPENVEFFRESHFKSDSLAYRVAKVRVAAITPQSATPPRNFFSDAMSISSPSYVSPSPPSPPPSLLSIPIRLTRSSPSISSANDDDDDFTSPVSLLKSAGDIQAQIQKRYPTLDPGASLLRHMEKPRMRFMNVPGSNRFQCKYEKTFAHFVGPCSKDKGGTFYFLVLNKSVPHIVQQIQRDLTKSEQLLQQSLHQSTLPNNWMAIIPDDQAQDSSVLTAMMSAPPNVLGEYLARTYGENCSWGIEAVLASLPSSPHS